jgi:hypothetical protein
MKNHFKKTDYTELKGIHRIFLVSLILIGSFVFFLPVLAEETSSSTLDVVVDEVIEEPAEEEVVPDPVVEETPTSTTEVIEEEDDTPTSTPEIIEETPTSTLEVIGEDEATTTTIEIETPTSTPTSTPEITTPTSTPTSTPEIETPTATPTSTPEITTPTSTPTSTEQNPEVGSGGSYLEETSEIELISDDEINLTIQKILNYFKSEQDETGKIMDGTVTDWAIMSFGADGQYADDIKITDGKTLLEYEKEYNLDDPSDMNSCATYPRHVLALLAAGVETSDPAILGLREKMNTICYIENSYGLNGINDDVFALLALLALDTSANEIIITDIIIEIKSWQLESGAFSWPDWFDPTQKTAGDDITGAAINALKYADSKGASIEQDIYSNAAGYLKTTQQTDGGWGWGSSDIMTTSWVLMGINALEETQADWLIDEDKNPWHPLTEQVNSEGFYESAWVPGTVDWFAMKHAVLALAGTSWPVVLDPIVEDFSTGATFTYGGGGSGSIDPEPAEIITPTSTPTSTLDIDLNTETTTSTPTTTLEILEEETPTSTAEVLPEIILDEEEVEIPLPVTEANPNYNPPAASALSKTKQPNEASNIAIEQNSNNNLPSTSTDKTELTNQVLSSANTTTIPYSKTAKGVFAGATSMAGALGLYLGWRFLQTLV